MAADDMRILILDKDYPSPENNYGDAFVEMRVRGYRRLGHEVKIVRFFLPPSRNYLRDSVVVEHAEGPEEICRIINAYSPTYVFVHFYQGWMLRKVFMECPYPVMIWVHGFEALAFYRRLFHIADGMSFFRYCLQNCIQLVRFHQLVNYSNSSRGRIGLIFVSQWMRRIASIDTLSSANHATVIPNPIDTEYFAERGKGAPLNRRILLIRSFDSRKYATDIACQAVDRFLKCGESSDCRFTIVGQGRYFERDTRRLQDNTRVSLVNGFLTHEEIRELHRHNGVLLCPTRQDAQGVSMCEAMSSGLVPITSSNTAIPEFVTHNQEGILSKTTPEIVSALKRLATDEAFFKKLSINAARRVRVDLSIPSVTNAEIAFVTQACKLENIEPRNQ